jgi:hypothetical protein
MIIHEPKPDTSRAKEVKVKIPVSHHIRLHSMKVLTGKQISDAITEALDAYFASAAFEESIHLTPPVPPQGPHASPAAGAELDRQ